ncbi:MAG: endonuclease/exonuclease/phosphatase family protein [Anaerolineae bacterium]
MPWRGWYCSDGRSDDAGAQARSHHHLALRDAYTGWFALRSGWGDALWWLALLNTFAPFLFAPLLFLPPLAGVIQRRAAWLGVALPLTLFLFLYGEHFLPRPSHFVKKDVAVSVMSFNIWGWSRAPETARVIYDMGLPDVVLLQELSPQMAETILTEVGDVYPHHLLETAEGYRGMGILSRYPLRELDTEALTASSRWRMQVVEVILEDRPFVLYHCHLQSTNILYLLEANLSLPRQVRASFAARERMINALKTDIEARGQPVIVAGDFNSTDQSAAYRMLAQALTEAHRAVGWGFGHTFPAYAGRFRGVPIPPRLMRLDMVFYSRAFVALRSRVGGTHGESDHLPVVVEMAWRDQAHVEEFEASPPLKTPPVP